MPVCGFGWDLWSFRHSYAAEDKSCAVSCVSVWDYGFQIWHYLQGGHSLRVVWDDWKGRDN